MGKCDELMNTNDIQKDLEQQLDFASQGLDEIIEDVLHTAEVYDNAEKILNDIDEKFKEVTGLDGVDVTFLFFATGLQIIRQYFITNRLDRMTDQEAAKKTKGHNEEHSNRKRGEWFLPTAEEIISNPVPFDAQRKTKSLKNSDSMKGMGKLGHRLVLGHDPVLGWVFGTANIATSTITENLKSTYHVKSQLYQPGFVAKIDYISDNKKVSTGEMLEVAFERFFKNGLEGYKILAAALLKEWVHLKSDIGTKNSLPLPIVSTISPELTNCLAKYGFDMFNVAAFAKQAICAESINAIIAILHGMYCCFSVKKDETSKLLSEDEINKILKLNAVKTRKILSISNLIASLSNVIVVAAIEIAGAYQENAALMKKGLQYLDLGGLAITAYRLISDTKFINEVKREFIEKEWYDKVVGEDYKFVREVNEMSKKDINRGIEIQAKADVAKTKKIAGGLSAHAKVLNNIKDTQNTIHEKVDVVLQDKRNQELEKLYGIKRTRKICDLADTEKIVLGAVIYTLMSNYNNNSELQKQFYECVELCGASERVEHFDFDTLRNIDSFSDRRIILKAICAFLFLKDCNFDFKNNPEYSWISAFTSDKDVEDVCMEIEKECGLLGSEGVINGFLSPLDTVKSSTYIEETDDDNELLETIREENFIEDEPPFYGLMRIIENAIVDEKAFGKREENIDQKFIERELGDAYSCVSASAVIAATKITNVTNVLSGSKSYLIFTTHALYLKPGGVLKSVLGNKYVRLPYKKIDVEKISMTSGMLRGTRKIIIPYVNENDKIENIELDNITLDEEKLRDLLIEIKNSEVQISSTDENIQFEKLNKETILKFLSVLVTVLKRNGRVLTEAYLLVKDFGLQDEWDKIVSFEEFDKVNDMVDEFLSDIQYPSREFISHEAMRIFLRTMTRTNNIEGKDETKLSYEEESVIKRFGKLGKSFDNDFTKILKKIELSSDVDFTLLLKRCCKNMRDAYKSKEKLQSFIDEVSKNNIKYNERVLSGFESLLEKLNDTTKNKNNRKNKTKEI